MTLNSNRSQNYKKRVILILSLSFLLEYTRADFCWELSDPWSQGGRGWNGCDRRYGYSSNSGDAWCPGGSMNPGCACTCVPCPAGYYSNSGWTNCAAVGGHQYTGQGAPSGEIRTKPTGYQVRNSCSQPMWCPPGTVFANSGWNYYCTSCPSGSYCQGGTHSAGVGQPYYAVQSSAWRSRTEPGQHWASGGLYPKKCALEGYYWDSGNGICVICPAGNACPSSKANTYLACASGFYAPRTGMAECLPCPPGHYCSSTTATECPDGQFSRGYQASCTACPPGYQCPNKGGEPELCPRGSTSAGSRLTCIVLNDASNMATSMQGGSAAISSTCAAGEYYVYNATDPVARCNPCPRGHRCPNKNAWPIPCDTGYYQNNEGQTSCIQCPAGYMCPYPERDKVQCPAAASAVTNGNVEGYNNSPAGSVSCAPYIVACTAGYYKYPSPEQQEIQCPEGYSCNDCFAPPTLCPRGYYSDYGATTCTLCEAGWECPTPFKSTRRQCTTIHSAENYYSTAGSLFCYPIPSHMYTTSQLSTTRPLWCKFGEYSALRINDCQICPDGSWCPGDNFGPIDCPAEQGNSGVEAHTSFAGEHYCYAKLGTRGGPTGSSDGALTVGGGTNLRYKSTADGQSAEFDFHVTPGKYAQIGGEKQRDCPHGRECLFPWENIFTQCPPGYFNADGYTTCQPCPEGKVCPIMQKQYIEDGATSGGWTQAGYFSPYGVHIELRVPAGWHTWDTANFKALRACPLGWYSEDGNTLSSCTICPIGYNCPIGSNLPIRCNEGTHAPSQGMHECTPCSDNEYYNPSTHACVIKPDNFFAIHPIFEIEACQYNSYSSSSTFSDNSVVDCVQSPGNYNDGSNSQTCPSGFYCMNQGKATTYTKLPCPPGTYTTGATGQNKITGACQLCEAGNYCPGGDKAKTTCPAGYICPEGTQFATQYPCPIFTYNPNTGKSLYSDCQTCTAGKKCLEGTSTPFDCPPGEDCSQAPWLAGPCASGTYSSAGACAPCSAGEYCITGASYGLKCPSGTYTAGTGAKSPSDCTLSSVDSPVPKYGLTATPTDYPTALGYVYPKGTAFSHQLPCPYGQVCDANTAARAWTACPSNKACPYGSSTSTAPNCEIGYQCTGGTVDVRQTPYASGTYSMTVGGSAINCPAGFYCPKGTTRPRSCPLGYYCAANTEDFRDYPCAIGTYGKTIELKASGDCQACPAGRYCQPGTPLPQLCPKGTFSTGGSDSAFTTSGIGLSSPCTPCTGGSYCPVEGMGAAYPCGVGFFSPVGSTVCYQCYSGYLCDTTTNSQTYMESNKCGGKDCNYPQYREDGQPQPSYQVESCPAGYYCDENDFVPIPCPVGTYQDSATAQTSISTCKPVPDGYYNDEVGQVLAQVMVKKCAPGYICSGGAISAYHEACPPGKFVTDSAQTSCGDCPAGYYCLGATAHPIPCPAGYYCELNTIDPKPCPISTFGATVKLTQQSECTTCTKGSYCAEPGALAPTALCNAGYYCTAGSSVPEQNICPKGAYCEQGSFEGKNCPAGYYNLYENMKTFKDCALCTPGQYCDGENPKPPSTQTGKCQKGYYCIAGSRVIDQYPSDPGYYSLEGAAAQTKCPAKTYNPLYAQWECLTCKEGFYCPEEGMKEPYICPKGHYCPAGSESYTPCPVGTYNPVFGAIQRDQNGAGPNNAYCLKCPAGRYCAAKGLVEPTGDCNAGYFCRESAETNKPSALDEVSGRWGKCPPGHYCPIATAYPYPCPAGSFQDSEKLTADTECTPCTAGKYCLTRGLTAVTGDCDAGFFCPSGSISPRMDANKCTKGNYCPTGAAAQIPCAPGTYANEDYQDQCIACPAGYYCPQGAILPTICPQGSSCIKNSGNHALCIEGKFQRDEGQTFCLTCPSGYACPTRGIITPTIKCQAGYYCTENAITATPTSSAQGGNKCSIGHYCPEGSAFELKCPPGKACPNEGMTDVDISGTNFDCEAGYYCTIGAWTTKPTSFAMGGNECPAGHYCEQQSHSPMPCPPGTYKGDTKGKALSDCIICPNGNFCQHYGSTSFEVCDDGWWCENDGVSLGETSGTPIHGSPGSEVPRICPIGHYCVGGNKLACQNKYQDQIGQFECKTCPAGYQCTTEVMKECGNSNYCPSGEMNPTPCPDGSYTLKRTASASLDCKQCPPGFVCTCTRKSASELWCDGAASITKCTEGYWCPAGTYQLAASADCPPGYICPEGTFELVPCPPGKVCDNPGTLLSTVQPCPAGYYCPGGSTTSTAKLCDKGHICASGSKYQLPCEIGYYNPLDGQSDPTKCIKCDPGKTCNTRGAVEQNESGFSCESGYFCPDDLNKVLCPKGFYCPANSDEPIPCEKGQYTSDLGQAACSFCPAGFYCGDETQEAYATGTPSNLINNMPIPCPAGHFCAKGSYMNTISGFAGVQCTIGLFNPWEGARTVGDCVQCPEGYMCTTLGLDLAYAALTPCTQGFYCPGAEISKDKLSCPVGHYCETGVSFPSPCSAGSYRTTKEATAQADCTACEADYYCSQQGMSERGPLCGDGFVCLGSTTVGNPTTDQNGDFCPIGYECKRTIAGKHPCKLGYYNPNVGESQCLGCPAGRLCNVGCLSSDLACDDSSIVGLTAPVDCPVGKYCPKQTNAVQNEEVPCPPGTYNDELNIGSADECKPCPVGKYCNCVDGSGNNIGCTAVSDALPCDAGVFCPYGSSSGAFASYSVAYKFGQSASGLCPMGYYCAQGTLAPEPCPTTTYLDEIGKTLQTDCKACLGGYYCDEKGMAIVDGDENQKCDPGYYCTTGSDIPNPIGDPSGKGDKCAKGFYCPKGSPAPTACAPGYYERRDGSEKCQECPVGYYCDQDLSLTPVVGCFTPIECQNGYCPAKSSAPQLCPDGTYGSEELKKMQKADDCPFCPNTMYCQGGKIVGECDAGYWCDFGAAAWRDASKICEVGHYCPAGTKLPVRCPETLYYAGTGATDVSYCQPCKAGYYCLDNDSVSRVCPKGHFCPPKTKEPVPCPKGTYNPYKKSESDADCTICPGGAFCSVWGIDDWTRYPCPAGHYCPNPNARTPFLGPPIPCPPGTYRNQTQAANEDECWPCTVGHFCEEGADYPEPCDAGYYCPERSYEQQACEPGNYCPALSSDQIPCPKGYYCPGYRVDIYSKCMNGTYCGEGQDAPTPCPAGSFGTGITDNFNLTFSCIQCNPGQYSDSVSKTCLPCEAGYICFRGAKTARPNSPEQNGQMCDAGFYCLKGATSGIACPIGTFSNEKGNGQLNQCKPCPANSFQDNVGSTECKPCQGNTVSDIGSSTCRCVGLNRKYLGEVGRCVCLSGYEPVEPDGAEDSGFSDCQRIIYASCAEDEERDMIGRCRKKNDCETECQGPGTLNQNFGICQCENIVTTQQICNSDCQQAALQISFTSEGKVRVYDPEKKTEVISELPNTIGSAKCSKEDQSKCEVVGVGMSDSGSFQGNYNLPSGLTSENKELEQLDRENIQRRKSGVYSGIDQYYIVDYVRGNSTLVRRPDSNRRLQAASADAIDGSVASYIKNPVVCTTSGSAMLFDSLSEEKYPVYLKDSLLNTNQNFDYGAFSALPEQLKGKTNQNFVFTFEKPGIYVFSDSRKPEQLMVISVMADDQKCPAGGKISPLTYASLLKVGAYREDVLMPPDWTFFFLNLFAFIFLIVLSVCCVTWIARTDWRQRYVPAVKYQQQHYSQVERSDPADKKAIVSINTDSSSFMFRAQGLDDGTEDQMVHYSGKGKRLTKQQRKRVDLSLSHVESLKDAMHKHLKEIKKLRAIRYGKDGGQVQDQLGNEISDYTESSEDDLNAAIANVKRLVLTTRAVLRGEGEDETQIFTADTKMLDAYNAAEDKRLEREEAIRIRKEELEEQQRIQEEKFKRKLNIEFQHQADELEDLKNKVLEMQVESAYDRGKHFQERLLRDGQNEADGKDMMDQLENKMQRVEDLLLDDKDRQNDMLRRQLEQRRVRRRKLNEKLVEIDESLHKKEYEEVDEKNELVKDLQEELRQEMQQLEEENITLKKNVEKKYENIKAERLADFQDKLKLAGGTKDFQNILLQYQLAQAEVDKELKRQIDKENGRLDRDLKARKAKAKTQAEIRRNERFKQLEIDRDLKHKAQIDGKKKIEEALSTADRKDETLRLFQGNLKMKINQGNQLVHEMERKRRDEEALRQQHERDQRVLQGEAMKEAAGLNKEVEDEIERLMNFNSYEPFQQLVAERSMLQKQVQMAQNDEERELLLRQLNEVDEAVKNQLGREAKDQDAALRRKLDARRLRREKAIEKEKVLKEQHIQKRIDFALVNSTDFAIKRNQMTLEAFDKLIEDMRMRLTPEEIPAAMENLIDDKHMKELSDWLLKLYEQKAIELKEEILTLMEEKIAKQQVLKRNFIDRKRGIDAIIKQCGDPAQIKELQQRLKTLEADMIREVNQLETEFVKSETRITREIQEKSMDRETRALQEMSQMHMDEKRKIFDTYLPDSLMKDVYAQLAQKEQDDMDMYKKQLEILKKQKLEEMEREERQLQAELAEQQSKLQKLSAEEQAIAKREMQLQRRQMQEKKERQAVASSEEVIAKMRNDMEKGLEQLGGAYEEEHKRQLAIMEERIKTRAVLVQEAQEQRKLDLIKKAELQEIEKRKELEQIRQNRQKKQMLEETIAQSQKLVMKGCYSRPLVTFNKKLHEAQLKNNNMAILLQNQSQELKEQVMERLLKKVTDLEEKVTFDTAPQVNRGKRASLFNRLGVKAQQQSINDNQSVNSEDKVSNAKQLIGHLLKKKNQGQY